MTHPASHRFGHPDPAPTDKASWRRAIRQTRRSLDAAGRQALAEGFRGQVMAALAERKLGAAGTGGAPRRIAAYLSAPDEPDTTLLLRQLVDAGYQVYLPVCEPGRALSWTSWEPGTELAPSRFAPVDEPVGERHGPELFATIELMFIPALAVDSAGMRLGQGGGYYDRFLPLLDGRGTRIAALVHDDEFVEAGSFEVDRHDRPVGLVITPTARHELENGF